MRSFLVTLLLTTVTAKPDGPGGHHHHHHGAHGDHAAHGHHAVHHGAHGAHNTVSLGTHQVGGVIKVQPAHHAVHQGGHHQEPVHHNAHHQEPVHHNVHHQEAVHHNVHHQEPVHHNVHHQEPVHHNVHHQQDPVHVVHAVHSIQPVQGHFRVEAGGEGSQQSSNSVAASPVETKTSGQTVADILSTNPKFSTLLTAVKAADLLDTLGQQGPFTVFAPTNTAFDKVPVETLNSLLNNKDELKGLLLRHVVSGTKMQGKNFPPGTSSLNTLAGESLSVTRDKFIQLESSTASAYIVLFDMSATNGVIHAVDTVF